MVIMTKAPVKENKQLVPRDYQVTGINWLKSNKRAMLVDEPGLGKTLQAAEAAAPYGPILVAAPTYLGEQWFDFLVEQYPTDSVVLATGTRKQRQKALKLKAKWYIINTEMLRSDYILPTVRTVIFDESHHLRHRESSQSKAASALAKQVERVYLLTATPIVKDPDDVYHQLHMIDPKLFNSYWQFIDEHFYSYQTSYGTQITGIRNKAKFKQFLSTYMLGRTYSEVGLELPRLINHTIKVKMTNDARKAYDDLRFYYAHEDITMTNASQVMHALRTICAADPNKHNQLIARLQTLDSFTVFCYYKHTAKWIADATNATMITGDVKADERPTLARRNNRIVCTLDSMSEGVDLSHIKNVFFYEEYYTHGVMYQALHRVQRFVTSGNPDPIYCYYYHCEDSIDEVIHAVQTRRSVTVAEVVKKELEKAK